mgnify:CR=1 FL=1
MRNLRSERFVPIAKTAIVEKFHGKREKPLKFLCQITDKVVRLRASLRMTRMSREILFQGGIHYDY